MKNCVLLLIFCAFIYSSIADRKLRMGPQWIKKWLTGKYNPSEEPDFSIIPS